MIKVLFCNVNVIKDDEIGLYLQKLPENMRGEASKYRHVEDQKARLLARLMLCLCLVDSGKSDLLGRWERDQFNKPFIAGWDNFSISHSGEMVVFSNSKTILGIDIEKKEKINYTELIENFHPQEQEFITQSTDIRNTFYELWVRKESFLKAIGTGIINGLHEFNCISESVEYKSVLWNLQPLLIHPGYASCLCAADNSQEVSIQLFQPSGTDFSKVRTNTVFSL